MITRLATVATAALVAGTLASTPAYASASAVSSSADPAVTGCAFTGLYATYSDGQLSGLEYYYPRNTALTVTGSQPGAWQVVVNRNGRQGWMDSGCVLFLA